MVVPSLMPRVLIFCLFLNAIAPTSSWAAPYSAQVLFPLNPPAGATLSNFGSAGDPQTMTGRQVAGAGAGPSTDNQYHGLLWNNGSIAIDMHPTNLPDFNTSDVYATDGVYQVGNGRRAGGDTRALMWQASPSTAVDLHPAGFTDSTAFSVRGGQQVGYGFLSGIGSGPYHALLWNGTAASAVDLHPTNIIGFVNSHGTGTDGNQQVGWAVGSIATNQHAILWNGTADSAIDLHPTHMSGFHHSNAVGVGGGQQVGFAGPGDGNVFAMLWSGTAASAINLHPAGYTISDATYTDGEQQAGFARGPDLRDHAMLWTGSSVSAVDLGVLLPTNLIQSRAYHIDEHGRVYGIAWDASLREYAIEWNPVPEPSSLIACLGGALMLGTLRRPKYSYESPTTSSAPSPSRR